MLLPRLLAHNVNIEKKYLGTLPLCIAHFSRDILFPTINSVLRESADPITKKLAIN